MEENSKEKSAQHGSQRLQREVGEETQENGGTRGNGGEKV